MNGSLVPGSPAQPAPSRLLRVDAREHAAELERFWAKVVRSGAAGLLDLDRRHRRRRLRPVLHPSEEAGTHRPPNRYAVAGVFGLVLGPGDVAENAVCDNPVCVRTESVTLSWTHRDGLIELQRVA